MGVYLAVQKKEKEAIPYFEKACEIFPPFAHAYFNLGLAHQRCFNIRGAIENYRTVIRLTHGNGEVGKMAEQAYEKLRVMIENEGLEVDEYLKSEDYFNEAFKLLTQKQFVASVGLFKKVLEIQPNHVQTHGNLGLAYAGLGQKALALEHLDKAMELDPKYEVAIINRIMVEKMEEGRAEAFDSIQEIHYYADYGPGKKSYTKEYMDMLLAQTDKKNSMEQTLEEHR
jgi:tetratricopeptide (TPR) repeat protein